MPRKKSLLIQISSLSTQMAESARLHRIEVSRVRAAMSDKEATIQSLRLKNKSLEVALKAEQEARAQAEEILTGLQSLLADRDREIEGLTKQVTELAQVTATTKPDQELLDRYYDERRRANFLEDTRRYLKSEIALRDEVIAGLRRQMNGHNPYDLSEAPWKPPEPRPYRLGDKVTP